MTSETRRYNQIFCLWHREFGIESVSETLQATVASVCLGTLMQRFVQHVTGIWHFRAKCLDLKLFPCF